MDRTCTRVYFVCVHELPSFHDTLRTRSDPLPGELSLRLLVRFPNRIASTTSNVIAQTGRDAERA